MDSQVTLQDLHDDELAIIASLLLEQDIKAVQALRGASRRFRSVVDGAVKQLHVDLRPVSLGCRHVECEDLDFIDCNYDHATASTVAKDVLFDTEALHHRCTAARALSVKLFCHPAPVLAFRQCVERAASPGSLLPARTPDCAARTKRAAHSPVTRTPPLPKAFSSLLSFANPVTQSLLSHGNLFRPSLPARKNSERAASGDGCVANGSTDDAPASSRGTAATALEDSDSRIPGTDGEAHGDASEGTTSHRAGPQVATQLLGAFSSLAAQANKGRKALQEQLQKAVPLARSLLPDTSAPFARAAPHDGSSTSQPSPSHSSSAGVDTSPLTHASAECCQQSESGLSHATHHACHADAALSSTAPIDTGDEASAPPGADDTSAVRYDEGGNGCAVRRARLEGLTIEAQCCANSNEDVTTHNGFFGYVYVPTSLASAWPVLKSKTRDTLSHVLLPVNHVPGMWNDSVAWDSCALADAIGMYADLRAALAAAPTLQHLCFRRVLYGRVGALALGEALPQLSHLQHLELCDTFFGDNGMQSIASALTSHSQLLSLNLHGNNINNAKHSGLTAILAANRGLTALDLSCNHMGQQSAAELREALASHTSLQRLDLSRNRFSASSVPALRQVVCGQPALEYFDVSANHHQGAAASAEALRLWLVAFTEKPMTELQVVRLHQPRNQESVSAIQRELLARVHGFNARFGQGPGVESAPVMDAVASTDPEMQELLESLTAAVRSVQPRLETLSLLPHVPVTPSHAGSRWPLQPVVHSHARSLDALATAVSGSVARAAASVAGGLESAREYAREYLSRASQ